MNSSLSSILFVNSSNQKFLLNEFIRFLAEKRLPVKKMQKIGVKRTKRNNTLRKEKLKRQKLEKKLEDDDPDYVPNILDAADSEDEGDVSNQKTSS